LDNALQAMANVVELIDDVDDADKRSDNDKYLDRRYRKTHAYEALDHLLTTALDKSSTLAQRYRAALPRQWAWALADLEGPAGTARRLTARLSVERITRLITEAFNAGLHDPRP
jgi:hypothetical protein